MPIYRKLRVGLCLAFGVVLLITSASGVHATGPFDARSGDECRAQVNANYDQIEVDMRAHGNYAGIPVVERRFRAPDLAACKNLDTILQYERLAPSLDRLTSAINDLRQGHANSPAAMQIIDADHDVILHMPPSPYRGEYLRQYVDYQRYLSLAPSSGAAGNAAIYRCSSSSEGVSFSDHPCASTQTQQIMAQHLPEHPFEESCEALRKHAADSRHAYDQAVDALLASSGQRGDGWRDSEDQRRHALSDLNWYTDRARLQGCSKL